MTGKNHATTGNLEIADIADRIRLAGTVGPSRDISLKSRIAKLALRVNFQLKGGLSLVFGVNHEAAVESRIVLGWLPG